MEHITSIRELINLWPTRAELASDIMAECDELKVSASQVHKWAENGSIPNKYHKTLIDAASTRGYPVTADLIVSLHAPRERVA